MKRLFGTGLAVVLTLASGPAFAHDDPNDDGDRYSTTRCDTYYRDGAQKDASGKGPNDAGYDRSTASSEHHESEFDPGDVTGTGLAYVIRGDGQDGVRTPAGYVLAIGGGGFNRDGMQGGAGQGEIDVAEGAPDADFHAGAYAGTDGSHSENACVSVADNKVGESGVQDPGTYCLLDAQKTTCTFKAREKGLRVYADLATGIRILVKRGTSTIHNVNETGPFVNESRSYAVRQRGFGGTTYAGDEITCTLTKGAAAAPAGRLMCSA